MNELEHQQYLLKKKMKEEEEKFQKFCIQVNESTTDSFGKNSALNRFFGQSTEVSTTCSANYRATPVLSSNGGWSVDESKHYVSSNNNTDVDI